jgi:hypothetical protein
MGVGFFLCPALLSDGGSMCENIRILLGNNDGWNATLLFAASPLGVFVDETLEMFRCSCDGMLIGVTPETDGLKNWSDG